MGVSGASQDWGSADEDKEREIERDCERNKDKDRGKADFHIEFPGTCVWVGGCGYMV